MSTTVEIDVSTRWDALALSQCLTPYHAYLVQRGHEAWRVHARAPGCHGEPLGSALTEIEHCLAERHVGAAAVRVGGRPRRVVSRG